MTSTEVPLRARSAASASIAIFISNCGWHRSLCQLKAWDHNIKALQKGETKIPDKYILEKFFNRSSLQEILKENWWAKENYSEWRLEYT